MANWYGLQRIADLAILSYVSDDSAWFTTIPSGTHLLGPYPTQTAAQTALEPPVVVAPSPDEVLRQTLVNVAPTALGFNSQQTQQALQLLLKKMSF